MTIHPNNHSRFPPEPEVTHTMGFWPGLQYQPRIPSCGGLKAILKVSSYPCNLHTRVGTSCLAGCFCGVQSLAWGDTTNCSPFLAACTSPSGTLKAIQQWGSFQVSSRWIFICPATKICVIFSNRVLPSRYSGNPREVAIALAVLGSL